MFQETLRRLLVGNALMAALLILSYAGIALTDAEASPQTNVVIQLGAGVLLVNFAVIGVVLYSGWDPIQ